MANRGGTKRRNPKKKPKRTFKPSMKTVAKLAANKGITVRKMRKRIVLSRNIDGHGEILGLNLTIEDAVSILRGM